MTPRAYARFRAKYVVEPSGCWQWTGAATTLGYGKLCYRGRQCLAHRLSYEHHVGPIPTGMLVLHSCDVPGCVNLAHLFLGTPRDNMQDMARKGRQVGPRGERHRSAKLTEEDVRTMRAFERLGGAADFVVAPDVVADASASLKLTRAWLPLLASARLVLVSVQDGMRFDDVEGLVGVRVGVFMGGSTAWKLANLVAWGRCVNTVRRIKLCAEAGADSFDGSSVSRFAKSVGRLDRARRQGDLFGGVA